MIRYRVVRSTRVAHALAPSFPMMRSPSQLPGIIRSAMSGRFNRSIACRQWVVCARLQGVSYASIAWRAGTCRARSASSWGASIHVSIASLLIVWPWAWGELSIGATVPHASTLRRCADLAGRAPLRQISNHAAAHNLIAVQEPLLGAAPGNLRRSPGVLGLVYAARTPVAGDLTAHHRRATPNRAGDTHLGQASLQPHHNRRAILNT